MGEGQDIMLSSLKISALKVSRWNATTAFQEGINIKTGIQTTER